MHYDNPKHGTEEEVKELTSKIIDLCMESNLHPSQCIQMFMDLVSTLGETMNHFGIGGTRMKVVDMKLSPEEAGNLIAALKEMEAHKTGDYDDGDLDA